jgi:acyl-CoA synthetase (AMP-forming)/AMP-acid ligase II
MNGRKHSYCHRGGETPLLGATIPEHFAQVARTHAEREALVSLPQQRRLSYAELAVAIDRVAAGLVVIGFARGDRLGIWSTNNLEWLQLATARIGVVLVNINPGYQTPELAYALERSEVQGLAVIPRFRGSDYVAIERCTAIHGVPTMFIAELEHPRFREFDLSSLRTGIMAGAPCAAALMRRVIGDVHCREILIGYGETEASPLTHLTHPEDSLARRAETVGTNLPHQDVKVMDLESGPTLPLVRSAGSAFAATTSCAGTTRRRISDDSNGQATEVPDA